MQGSLEAILGSLDKLGTDEVAARILHAGVGGISEIRRDAGRRLRTPPIIGFNVRAHKEAAAAAKRNGIEIRYYNIIYDLVDDVKKAMSGLLAPTLRETFLGNAADPGSVQHLQGRQGRGLQRHRWRGGRGAKVRLLRDNVVDPGRQADDAEALQG